METQQAVAATPATPADKRELVKQAFRDVAERAKQGRPLTLNRFNDRMQSWLNRLSPSFVVDAHGRE